MALKSLCHIGVTEYRKQKHIVTNLFSKVVFASNSLSVGTMMNGCSANCSSTLLELQYQLLNMFNNQ